MKLTWSTVSLRRRDRSEVRRKLKHHRRVMVLESLEDRALLSTFTWNGSANSNWSNSGNWSVSGPSDSDGLPDSGDDVVFSGSPTNNSVVNQTFTVRSVTLDGTFTGSVSLGADLTSLGATAQAGFTQSGGTFNVNSYTLTSGNAFSVGGGTFNPGTGTVTFNTPINSGPGPISAAGVNFNDVNINYGSHHVNVGGGLHVNGDLTINGAQQLTGVIYANGNVTTTQLGMFSNPVNNGFGISRIVIGGSGNTTLSTGMSLVGSLPNVEINRTGGTLTILGNISVARDWTHVSGNVNAAASTIKFWTGTSTVDTNTMAFGNVTIDAGSHHFYVKKMKVGGDLLIANIQAIWYAPGGGSGAITVGGNLTSTDSNIFGPADITMVGTANATITGGDFPDGGIIINKGSAQTVTANVTQPLEGPLSLVSMSSLKGTFQVGRNVTTSDTFIGGNTDGSPVLVFKGNSAQTLTANVPNGAVPGLEFDKSGGSFTLVNNANVSGANALQVTGGWIVDATNVPAITLTGTNIKFINGSGSGSGTIDTGASAGFNNVELASGSGSTLTIPKMVVNGLLSITNIGTITGTIDARGDVSTSDTGVSSGPGTILFNGTGNQVLTATVADAQVPSVGINKTAGTLSFGANRIGVTGNWTYTAGTVNAAGSTISFQGFGSRTITTGVMSFNDVDIFKGSGDTLTITDALTVGNDLTIRSIGTLTAATGAITVAGDLTSTDTGVGGTADITMVGATNATLNGGDFPNGGIIINKTVGSSVALGSNLTGVSKLTVTSGTLDFGTHTMAVSGAASVAAAGTLAFTANGTQQLTVNGALTFASGSKINITSSGILPLYTLIAVTGGNTLTDSGVVITGATTSSVTPGVNGTVKISI